MEVCGFFDAELMGEEYDRVYLANQFAAYFASFIGNGVFGGRSDELQVLAASTPAMQIVVKSGEGWINGYWYQNTDDYIMPIESADGTLSRIDSVVLRWGSSERNMWVAIKKGTPAISPVAPEVERDADYYELKLAEVKISAGAYNIQQVDITDTRMLSDVCGFVVGVVKQFDTTTFGNQLQTFINDYIKKADVDYVKYLEYLANKESDSDTEYDNYVAYLNRNKEKADADYTEYFASIDNLKIAANNVYKQFLVYIDDLKSQGDAAYQDYLIWLGNLRTTTEADLKALLEEIEGLINESVAAQMNERINKLEELNPTEQVADIEHNLGSYVHCDLFEFEYGAGTQMAGYGPAGGSGLRSTPVEYSMNDKNHIVVKTKTGYGTVDEVNKMDDTKYVVTFVDSIICLLIVMRK